MKILVLAVVVLAGAVAGAVAAFALIQSPIGPNWDQAQLRQVIADEIAAATPVPQYRQEELGPMVEQYLLANPDVLQRVSDALAAKRQAEQAAKTKTLIAENRDRIFSDTRAAVVGNPLGDVTLVEMYDYNCAYCRSAMPDLVALVDEDPNLRLVLRQFPILSQGSVDAAKVGVLVDLAGADYWSFHQALYTARGQIDGPVALREAAKLGLDEATLKGKLSDPEVTAALDQSYDLARRLGISGTPTFIIGDEIVPGAVGIEVLREKVGNMRACGSTICPPS